MTTNHHTAFPPGPTNPLAELTSTNMNAPFSALDSAITNIIGTDASNPLFRIGASSELTIATGAVTVTKSHHTIDTESDAASDDLNTMTIATSNVFGIITAADGARTVVVKHNTGNILTWDGSDISLDDTNKALLYYYDGTNVRILSIIPAGGGGSIGGSTGATDNAIIRANGTGGATVQSSGVLIDDSDNITNVNRVREKASVELTIATGAVTATQQLHTIDTESDAASDDLDTISGGTAGDHLYITANNAARTVVVKHGTGNILTWDGSDISLDETRKMLHLFYDGTNWIVIAVISGGSGSGLYTSVAILSDTKTSGTNGGGASSGWNARDLQTEDNDADSIVSISSNTFTPISGTYRASWHVSVFGSIASNTDLRTRLYNSTGAAAVDESANVRIITNSGGTLLNHSCIFTANGTDAYRIDTYHSVAQATVGLGAAASDGSPEKYLVLVLEKLS